TLAGMSNAATIPNGVEAPETRDPDSKSPIFDSQLMKRGGEDSTVNIRPEDSASQGMKQEKVPVQPSPALSPLPLRPTVPMMITPAKAAGIAPRPQSSPPFVIGNDPPSPLLPRKPQRNPQQSPLPFPSPLEER